ncbi:gamma-glutamyl-gamma-aminobutyrate hydrolase family protein, partial [Caldilinea sp.]|uniref:gamma-glutamyl-gamma-aminobutyrate hydrolase family protein n=1 Tax=Caldilinea sp. TaxID=2293560 RepID=UPI002BDE7A16|nr:gamma-glutamyl-gamma-aminobutyrate hydrolase family protein [Caldilinea sp.]
LEQKPMTKIGITLHPLTSPDREELDLLARQIAEGVVAAGGAPVFILPDLEETALYAQFSSLDGLILSGGGDVAPARYGEQALPQVGGVDEQRDHTETTLVRWALAAHKPLFGICRGLQLLNVACGGALYQDVSQHAGAIQHAYYPSYPHDYLAHAIAIAPESQLATLLGKTAALVNSLHHQACRTVAPGLRVVAHAPDGIVEAVEITEHPFALAVQWHPEALSQAVESKMLFGALVAASAQAQRESHPPMTQIAQILAGALLDD